MDQDLVFDYNSPWHVNDQKMKLLNCRILAYKLVGAGRD